MEPSKSGRNRRLLRLDGVKALRRYHSPQRRARLSQTRQIILQAAERLFADVGYESTTIEAVARRASVSVATVYLHFRNKPALIGCAVKKVGSRPSLAGDLP